MRNLFSLGQPNWAKSLLLSGLWGAALGVAGVMPSQGGQAQSQAVPNNPSPNNSNANNSNANNPKTNRQVSNQQGSNTNSAKSTHRFPFPSSFTPPGDGRPQKTRGAGARDELRCRQDGPVLRAIMPPGNYGLTLEERPQVTVDFAGEVVPAVLLAFKDETGKTLERVKIQVESTESIQRFALPNSMAALTVGKNYQWSLLVACDGQVNPSHPIFSGWVQRVSNTDYLADYLQQQPVSERVDWLARYGYWYDAVVALTEGLEHQRAKAQSSDREPLNTKLDKVWQGLLEFVDSKPQPQAQLTPSSPLS